jgi:hypothetical protein
MKRRRAERLIGSANIYPRNDYENTFHWRLLMRRDSLRIYR